MKKDILYHIERIVYFQRTKWLGILKSALSEYLSWESIDEETAKAVMKYEEVKAEAAFYVNEKSDLYIPQ